jgi:hypothetical protein
LRNEANNDNIHHNIIIESEKGIKVHSGAYSNNFNYNTIINPKEIGISVEDSDSVNNKFENNNPINSKVAEEGGGEEDGL